MVLSTSSDSDAELTLVCFKWGVQSCIKWYVVYSMHSLYLCACDGFYFKYPLQFILILIYDSKFYYLGGSYVDSVINCFVT